MKAEKKEQCGKDDSNIGEENKTMNENGYSVLITSGKTSDDEMGYTMEKTSEEIMEKNTKKNMEKSPKEIKHEIYDMDGEIIESMRSDLTSPDWYINRLIAMRNRMAKKIGEPMINLSDLMEDGYFICDKFGNRMPYPI